LSVGCSRLSPREYHTGICSSHQADRPGEEAVQQICGGVEPLYLVASRNGSLKKQGTQHTIDGAKDALGFTILRRSVWNGSLKKKLPTLKVVVGEKRSLHPGCKVR
jgi:hypothetical protein